MIPPRKTWIGKKWYSLCMLACVLISPAFLQGCDGLTGPDQHDNTLNNDYSTLSESLSEKLRHPGLLGAATRTKPGSAGKDGATTADLYLGFSQYEADGITPRVLNRYEITNRIVEEYGITRRVLNKYGITKRVLDKYGITRRIVNRYGITKRVLDKYGLTPRVLKNYNDQVTMDLLAEYGLNDAKLAEEGLSVADIDGLNELSAVLGEYGITIEKFVEELNNAIPRTARQNLYRWRPPGNVSLSRLRCPGSIP